MDLASDEKRQSRTKSPMEKLKFLLIIFAFGSIACCENFSNDNLVFGVGSAKVCEAGWPQRRSEKQMKDFFNEFALSAFEWDSALPENSKCRILMDGVYEEARKLNLWALRLLDASAKLPSGILSGNLNQFGDYDECLSSKGRLRNQTIQGKYCLANIGIKFNKNQTNDRLKKLDSSIHSNWILHNEFRDQGHRIPKFETFNIGLCVPSSCDIQEMETALTERLNRFFEKKTVTFEVSITDEVCYVEKENPISLDKWIVWFLFIALAILTVMGTLVDTKRMKIYNSRLMRFLICFSLKRNVLLLLKTSTPPDDIKCIHGARFLNAVALLLSHKQIAMLFSPMMNRTPMSESVSKGWTMIGRSAILYTDSFILFSGLLMSYSTVKDLDNKNFINFKDKLISRIVRLLPNLMGVILFCTYIMDDMNSGPQWGLVVSKYTNLCKKYMWRNFLFIHNYYGFENMCLTHTHQLGIDMQLFLVSPLFIYIIWKTPKIGALVLSVIAAVSTWLRYDVTHRGNLSTLLYYGISVEQLWKTANNSYIMPTHRLTVYLIGIMLGYYLRRGGQNLNLTFFQATIGWIFAIISAVLAIFGPYQAAFKEYVYDVNDAVWFNAYAPILWTVFLSWGLLACFNGCGGILNDFLCWKYFTIFTRISYAVYLTQFPVFFYNVGTERTPQYYKGFQSLFDVEELSVIFIVSVVLTLAFDIPFQEVKKYLTSVPGKCNIEKIEKVDEDIRQENKTQRGRRRLQSFGT